MIIYCDGSSNSFCATTNLIGWAIVAQHEGNITELAKGVKVQFNMRHLHETFAIVEAILYAVKHGKKPQEVSFYTDDLSIVQGTRHHNVCAWGDTFTLSPALQKNLDAIMKLYPTGTMEVLLPYFEFSHISWVKGHSGTMMNSRADHLAKRAMRCAFESTVSNRKKTSKQKLKTQKFTHWARNKFLAEDMPFKNHMVDAPQITSVLWSKMQEHVIEHIGLRELHTH